MTSAPAIAAAEQRVFERRETLRNIAVIAHVDHGKTTLVDGLLKQSKVFRDADAAGTLIMDSNELERERGITVFAKNAAIKVGDVKINLIDTPGHSDFSSEVERTLSMADGCLLLVDAAEGPLPQTRFVLGLALELGLRPLVVVNKVDRKDARPAEVVEEIADLFLELAHDSEQLSYPVIYAIARDGRAGLTPDALADDLGPLFKAIMIHVPAPLVDVEGPAQLLVSALDYDPHRGRIAIGRVTRGAMRRGQSIRCIGERGPSLALKLTELFEFQGLGRQLVDVVEAGDIAALAGVPDVAIGDTIADADVPEALPRLEITEPTVQLTIGPNTSPLAGQDGKAITSRQLKERLDRELQTNVGLRIREGGGGGSEGFVVAGRGELHLAILLETLRREGLEFSASRPEVILKREDGKLLEPMEEAVITVPQEHLGTVSELVGPRQAIMEHMTPDEGRGARLVYRVPTRGLIGLRGALLTATRGTATVASRFLEYAPVGSAIPRQRNGAVVATESGTTTSYAIANVQERARRPHVRYEPPVASREWIGAAQERALPGASLQPSPVDVHLRAIRRGDAHAAGADRGAVFIRHRRVRLHIHVGRGGLGHHGLLRQLVAFRRMGHGLASGAGGSRRLDGFLVHFAANGALFAHACRSSPRSTTPAGSARASAGARSDDLAHAVPPPGLHASSRARQLIDPDEEQVFRAGTRSKRWRESSAGKQRIAHFAFFGHAK